MDGNDSRKSPELDSTEEENAKKPLVLFGREFSRKQVCAAGAGILCAALLIGGGAYAISHASWTGDSNAPAVSQSKDDEKQDMVLTLEVKADGWDADTSTPVIAHIEDADGEVDFYTAIVANKQVTVRVGKSGTYTVTLIPPVNADGSTYKAASSKVKAGKDDKKANGTVITLEKVDAGKVTKDDLTAIAKDVAAAVKKGDSTLTGNKGAEVAKRFEDNIKKNPNADADAVEKESEKAQETAKEDKSDAKKPETSDNKKNDSVSKNDSGNNGSGNKSDSKPSGGSGNSGSGSSSGGSSKKDDTPAHQHNWVAQTKTVHHDAQYKTVHHDAVTHQVWHDAVTEEHYICNQCGADITSDPWGHLDAYDHGGYHSSYVTVKQGYYETVTDKAAYDEQVQVSAAWEETVTTGYKCSSCGATK
jgi:DNA-directed RNA polymerase subunit RPC12/RpoP